MPPLWEQRENLKREIRELLDVYLQTKTHEETREIALSYAMMVGDMLPIKRLRLWLDLVKALAVRSARLVARTEDMKRQGLSLVAIELECTIPFGSFAEEHGPFDTLHVDWDVPPFAGHASPLPADNPDAEDLMELPQ